MNAEAKHFYLDADTDVSELLEFVEGLRKAGRRPVVTVEYAKKRRTRLQNNSLHKFLALLAEQLNAAGLDMRSVLKTEIEIPWNTTTAKEYLWRPIQKIVTGEQSTADANTTDYTPVYDVLARHLAEKHGVRVPDWPCEDSMRSQGA